MNLRIITLVAVAVFATNLTVAQDAPPSYPRRDPSQLDQLLSPIALYPDPLLGAILPASTHPAQLASAANLVGSQNDPSLVAQQPWDDSVKALAQYTSVIEWMAQNSDWTNELGAAVLDQQQDVLDSIQRLRANARASGVLTDTPQQQVVLSGNTISIEPTQPDTVYVPEYDPQYIETRTPAMRFALQFGPAFTIRSGPRYNLDWRNHSVFFDRGNTTNRGFFGFARSTHQQWHPTATPARRANVVVNVNSDRNHATRPTRFEPNRTQARPITPTGRGPSVIYGNHQNSRTPHDNRDNRNRDRNDDRRDDGRDGDR